MSVDFSRRDFIKSTSLLAGGAGIFSALPASIRKAISINPELGSTFEDAEHVVLLMQENRSFDHCFGSLKGVRGFNDRNILKLTNGNPVWLQTDDQGKSYLPFRLDMQDTKITWMGGLPHSWKDQVDACNKGKYDQWLVAKKTGYEGFEGQPMTLGYYTREDLPFNYALADAFTVCDQHFCSSLTGTTSNRLYFWAGTLREDGLAKNPALVRNSEVGYSSEVTWKTIPELLQGNNISWKIYQNEISLPSGLEGIDKAWLGNFTDNNLEWFTQFRVRRSEQYKNYLSNKLSNYDKSLAELKERAAKNPENQKLQRALKNFKERKKHYIKELDRCTKELAGPLTDFEQALHNNAFVTNAFDPGYHQTEEITYNDNGIKRKMRVPKSDVLANFRKDVKEGNLPAVSWLVAPQYFSDHPSAPWFGAWYVSEVLNILTHDEEVWKKTIFILTYDENDGYFDHVPPFVAPDFRDKASGTVSDSIRNIDKEFVTRHDEIKQKGVSPENAREHAIGLGYRVPFVVASPWSRGGFVNSQIFDHTSVVQFLEKFASRKAKKNLQLDNVSEWRRAICGDLSSVFRPYNGEKILQPDFLKRDFFLQRIDETQYQPMPKRSEPVSDEVTQSLRADFSKTKNYFSQEKGVKPSATLPYELFADGNLQNGNLRFEFAAGKSMFKEKAMGSPFTVYSYLPFGADQKAGENWSFAVAAGEQLHYDIPLVEFGLKEYHFALLGPNGFYRELKGTLAMDMVLVHCKYAMIPGKKYGQVNLLIQNIDNHAKAFIIRDNAYGQKEIIKSINANDSINIVLSLDSSFGWYDFSVFIQDDHSFERKYAGRVENGKDTFSDPAMAR